ncbi:MAG: DUF58 domain-containing protein [Azoarcus sp.]|nr:DUF58 domain-containing protein [Azoarcus sp.]
MARVSRTFEAPPIKLGQNRIYVLPTLAGMGFATTLGVMLIASINYGLSLGYAFTFLLSGVALASVIHAFRNLLRLSIAYGRAEPAFCGDQVVYHLLVSNPAHRRRPALRLRSAEGETCFDLPPTACAELTLSLTAHQRGRQRLGRTVIETHWPLGLVRVWAVFMCPMEALVYPKPEIAPPLPPTAPGGLTEGAVSTQAGDDDFAGLRGYHATDSPRHLAWKTYARGGELMTKQFTANGGGDRCLDWFAMPETLDTEARLSRLAAWLLQAETAGQRYALRLPEIEFPPGVGTSHLTRCLGALAVHGLAHPHR